MRIFTENSTLTKKQAITILLVLAAVLGAAVLFCSSPGCRLGAAELIYLNDIDGRKAYLNKLGWEIDTKSEESRAVLLPREFDGVLLEYAKLQTKQGYDFASYGGIECTQYIYIVTNYPSEDTVYAVLYVKGGRVIGGDIHSAALDGFMHGLR